MNIGEELLWAISAVEDSVIAVMNDGTPSQVGLSSDDLARVQRDLILVHTMAVNLLDKAKILVEKLDRAETHEGGLLTVDMLTAKNQLRLELSRWK